MTPRPVRRPQPTSRRRSSRSERDAVVRGLFGPRAVRYLYLYWTPLKSAAQLAYSHRAVTVVTLVALVLSGWLGSLLLGLGVLNALGWGLLSWENRQLPRWRPATGVRPWRKPYAAYWRGWLDSWHCTLAAGASAFYAVLWQQADWHLAGALLQLVNLWVIVKLRVPPKKRPVDWRKNEPLLRTLVAVDLVKVPTDGSKVLLSYRGVWEDSEGEHVQVDLPGAVTWRVAAAKRDALAAWWNLPAEQVRVSHEPKTPESRVTISQLKERQASTTAGQVSPLCTVERTDARQPFRIGEVKDTGEPVLEENVEANTLVIAAPRSGKTEWVRIKMLPYLLDPRAIVFGMDGKGSRGDYGRVKPLCAGWVWGTDDDAPEQLADMLERVVKLIQHRNATDPDGMTDWPPVLLLLEELQDVRDAADDKTLDRIDRAHRRIIRMGGAPVVKEVISTQRAAAADDLPTAARNLINQRAMGFSPDDGDAKMALGASPTVPRPTARKGEWIWKTADSGQRVILTDRCPAEHWARALTQAAKVREGQPAYRDPDEPDVETPALHLVPAQSDPLLDAVLPLVADEPRTAAWLHSELRDLPDDVRGKDATELGKWLAKRPQLLKKSHKGRYCWHPSATLATPRPAPSHEGPERAVRARSIQAESLTLAAGGRP